MIWGVILAVASAFCFSTSAILAKQGSQVGLSPAQLLQLRFSFAWLMILAVVLIKDRTLLKPNWPVLLKGLLLGGVLYGIQSSAYYRALSLIPASTTALILYFYPVVVALLAHLFYKQKIRPIAAAALALVVGGCALVFSDALRRSIDPLGLTMAAAAMLCYSCYLIVAQRAVRNEPPLRLLFYVLTFAALTFNLLNGPAELLKTGPIGFYYGLGLATFSTVIGPLLLYGALDRIGSANTAVFSTFEPISVVCLSYLILGEAVRIWQIAGVILIVSGMVLTNLNLKITAGPQKSLKP